MLVDQDCIVINEFIEFFVIMLKIDGECWDNYIVILVLLIVELKMVMGEDVIKGMEKQQEVLEIISVVLCRDLEKKVKEVEVV